MTEYEIKPRNKLSINLKELWEFRELFYFFTWRDIKIKYKQTFLGALWVILQPVLMMLIFTVFFGSMLKVPTDQNVPYPIFVFSGLMLWNVFSNGLINAANSMVTNAHIIKKIYFPRIIIPFSAIFVPLFDFLMALAVFAGMMVYFQFPVSWQLFIYIPVGVLLTAMSTFGLGAILASLNIKYRDFKYIVPYVVQVLFFLTPVLYSISIAKEVWVQQLISLNPLTGAIHLVRSSITGAAPDLMLMLKCVLISFSLFFFGLFYFQKTEYYFADLA